MGIILLLIHDNVWIININIKYWMLTNITSWKFNQHVTKKPKHLIVGWICVSLGCLYKACSNDKLYQSRWPSDKRPTFSLVAGRLMTPRRHPQPFDALIAPLIYCRHTTSAIETSRLFSLPLLPLLLCPWWDFIPPLVA